MCWGSTGAPSRLIQPWVDVFAHVFLLPLKKKMSFSHYRQIVVPPMSCLHVHLDTVLYFRVFLWITLLQSVLTNTSDEDCYLLFKLFFFFFLGLRFLINDLIRSLFPHMRVIRCHEFVRHFTSALRYRKRHQSGCM